MERLSRPLLAATAALLLLPAVAAAQTDTTSEPQTTEQPPAARRPAARRRAAPRRAVGGRIGVWLDGQVYRVGGATLTMPGKEVRIGGRIVPYVPGQKVTIRVWNGDRLAKAVTVTPRPTKTKQTATFGARFTAGRLGQVRVFAIHPRTPQQARLASRAASVDIVNPSAGFGSSGPFVSLIQQKLAALGYAVPRSGTYDGGTGRAVEAYRKVNRFARLQTLDSVVTSKLLSGRGAFQLRKRAPGRRVEANLSTQTLALIENNRVVRTYTTSSGAPATPTVLGTYNFYWKQPGVNNRGMVHSAYFIRGYAIHGYPSVPTYPASHGCLRIPVPDALSVFNWLSVGDRIDVYY